MFKLKWFAGGTDRATQAVEIIDDLLHDLPDDVKNDTFKNVLLKYKKELEDKQSSVPFILSRMNVEISNILVKHELKLSESQSNKLKKLTSMSNIRYGY